MTNNIAKQSSALDLMPEVPELPMSSALYRAYEDTARPHPNIGPPRSYSSEVKSEAARALSVIAPYVNPPGRDMIKIWLQPIPFAVRNTKTEEEVAGWIYAFMLAATTLPCGAFTAANQRLALGTFKFFPSVADLVELLSTETKELRDKARILRVISGSLNDRT